MKVTVISASPKGENSITLHTLLWIEKNFKDCSFDTFHVGSRPTCWNEAYEAIRRTDLTVFCYPVYTFIAPSRLHAFMTMLKEKGGLEGKKYVQVTTSKHFYDTTAHAWLCDNCADLDMRYLGGLSADMEDLLTEKGRRQALDFWALVSWRWKAGISIPVHKIKSSSFAYTSPQTEYTGTSGKLVFMKPDDPLPEKPQPENKITVVASLDSNDTELKRMIEDFAAESTLAVEVFNVNDYPFKGSCISCFNCAATGKCIYTDNFDSYLRGRILTSRAIVYAFRIKDHSMGERMKVYDDRQFCNGHRTVTMGMPVGFLVAGDLSEEENLRTLMKARTDVGGNFPAGIANNYEQVVNLARTVNFALKENLHQPQMFLGVGGMKIFRDLIWTTQGLMRADHKFFKAHKQYDFPQKRKGDILKMYLVGMLMNNPKLKKKAGAKIAEGMIAPYKKALSSKCSR